MCAKYSDFLCIWLRKCDFLSGKVRYWPDPDPKLFIPDPDPDPDPAKSSGSGRIRIRIHNTEKKTSPVAVLPSNQYAGRWDL